MDRISSSKRRYCRIAFFRRDIAKRRKPAMHAIDPLYSVCGFVGGLLVGMTGVGGGSLMTPLLILLFGVHPATAVGTDLLFAAATKTGGSLVHGLARTIDWTVVRRLDEYRTLLDALVAEHKPEGPTEEHLVEELAGILWRKRRLRLAEGAAYRHGLEKANSPSQQTVKTALVHLGVGQQTERVVDAIRATADTTTQELADLDEDQDMTARALDLLQ